jgi:predicted dehydrogenase
VGLGYWGPNLARNFDRLPDAELAWLCDESTDALERYGRAFPSARLTTSFDDLLADAEL